MDDQRPEAGQPRGGSRYYAAASSCSRPQTNLKALQSWSWLSVRSFGMLRPGVSSLALGSRPGPSTPRQRLLSLWRTLKYLLRAFAQGIVESLQSVCTTQDSILRSLNCGGPRLDL